MSGVEVKTSGIHGRGLFATRAFHKGESVITWTHTREISQAELTALPKSEIPYVEFQNEKILLIGEPERYINHSCDANTMPGDMCDIAARDIVSGEEITADYANFTIPGGNMKCGCGSASCRGVVNGKKC